MSLFLFLDRNRCDSQLYAMWVYMDGWNKANPPASQNVRYDFFHKKVPTNHESISRETCMFFINVSIPLTCYPPSRGKAFRQLHLSLFHTRRTGRGKGKWPFFYIFYIYFFFKKEVKILGNAVKWEIFSLVG